MINPDHKKNKLEILISTTKKNNLDFVENIFIKNKKPNFNILIVNQSDNKINSARDNIKIINSKTNGLSLSRNIALENSSCEYCLFADDDIVYKKDFYKTIINAFQENFNADIITFMMEDKQGNLFKKYTNIYNHNERSIREVNSVVIAFKRDVILKNNLKFDTLFGLGSIFKTGDEYIFLSECLKKKLNIIFYPKSILNHNSLSSGKMAQNDENIFARAAIFYKFYGYLAYFKLIHHIYLLKRKKMIGFRQIFSKFFVGIKGINKFKSI